MESKKDKAQKKESYLLIHNINKRKNIGLLLQAALMFNTSKVFIIHRSKRKRTTQRPGLPPEMVKFIGDRNASSDLTFQIFQSIEEFKDFCQKESIFICGIEIGTTSRCLTEEPFSAKTCFILGNEGQGLVGKVRTICNGLCYIPHYSNKTASLNVATAGAIVLQRFAEWAEFEEMEIPKFDFPDEKSSN